MQRPCLLADFLFLARPANVQAGTIWPTNRAAIELAAARVSVLSVAQIAEYLDRGFELLRGTPAGAGRWQAIDTMIAWSYDLLDAETARFFRYCFRITPAAGSPSGSVCANQFGEMLIRDPPVGTRFTAPTIFVV